MSLFAFLQIGKLFEGHFNWRGAFHLFLFLLMGFVVVGFAAFVGYKAFNSKKN